jgi:hypothetical protein
VLDSVMAWPSLIDRATWYYNNGSRNMSIKPSQARDLVQRSLPDNTSVAATATTPQQFRRV